MSRVQVGRYTKFKFFQVTGAGNGLGREMARQLAKEKCTVLCVDIKPKDLELTLQLIADDPKNKGKCCRIQSQPDFCTVLTYDVFPVRIFLRFVHKK